MTTRVHSLVGDGGDRPEADFYATPDRATLALLECEEFIGSIWEPACGDGAISEVLKSRGYHVVSSDLYDRGYGHRDIDFLAVTQGPYRNIITNPRNIVTNPPFSLAEQFAWKALELTTEKVALLLRLNFLESSKRLELFRTTPLKKVYVFSKRLSMYPAAFTGKKTGGTLAYAWFVWEHGYTGEPTLGWIDG